MQVCPVCDTELGDSEKACPKCGADLEILNEDVISNTERVLTVIEKRKRKQREAELAEKKKKEQEQSAKKRNSFFDSLRRK